MKYNRKNLNKKNIIIISIIFLLVAFLLVIINIPIVEDSIINRIIDENMDIVAPYDKGENPEIEEEKKVYKKEHKESELKATKINVSSKQNGLNATIYKALYEKSKVYIYMTFNTDKPLEKTRYINAIFDSEYGEKKLDLQDFEIYINGKKLMNSFPDSEVFKFIDKNTVSVSYSIPLEETNDVNTGDSTNIKIKFSIPNNAMYYYLDKGNTSFDAKEYFKTKYSLSFNIKPEDDNQRVIIVNKKDNGHTLKKVIVNDNYVKIDMQIPFKQSMAKKKFYTNFIIVTDDKGREMEMSGGGGSEDKIIQIHDLINKGDIPKYINISIYKSDDPNRLNPLSSFKVNLK